MKAGSPGLLTSLQVNDLTTSAASETQNGHHEEKKQEPAYQFTATNKGIDPFIETEEDPAKCRALFSSLWEIQVC